MLRQSSLSFILIIAIAAISLVYVGCSQPPASSDKKGSKDAGSKPDESLVKPALGEVAFTLPKDWILLKQPASNKPKEVESLSFIRKIDQSLWANPGPVGTSNLPIMNILVSRRAADASRDDINPQKLGNSLVKQGVLSNLVEAEEIQVTNLPATKIVGDSLQQGRITIVLLPHNGYLYKWSLFGTKPDDKESAAALDTLLASRNIRLRTV